MITDIQSPRRGACWLHPGVALWLAACLTAFAVEPNLVCKERVHNFGSKPNNSVASHTFVLENQGDTPLVIKSVRTSCGCTTARVSKRDIASGESVQVEVRADLTGRIGLQNFVAFLHTNDPGGRIVRLSLRGVAEVAVADEGAKTAPAATQGGTKSGAEPKAVPGKKGRAVEPGVHAVEKEQAL